MNVMRVESGVDVIPCWLFDSAAGSVIEGVSQWTVMLRNRVTGSKVRASGPTASKALERACHAAEATDGNW